MTPQYSALPAIPSDLKTVILGVSGSVAAYKAADLANRFVKNGFQVYPVITRGAEHFVNRATFSALTGHPCSVDTFEEPIPQHIAHIWYAQNCDVIVVMPASMNLIARLAHGLADDMLTATILASKKPIILAPAMNTGMWENPATQSNLAQLVDRGYLFVDPVSGRLACSTFGFGKLADVQTVYDAVVAQFSNEQPLMNKHVVVTAGPTREAIDAVRYVSNRSSGKMGYAIAESALSRGARVTLISGPTALTATHGINVVFVESAQEMLNATMSVADADYIVAAAAVADFRPTTPYALKLKKHEGLCSIALSPTEDIVAILGKDKRPNQTLIQFCAETDNEIEFAREKQLRKGSDWVVANNVAQVGSGFDVDTNSVTIIGRNGVEHFVPTQSKRQVAEIIWDTVLS